MAPHGARASLDIEFKSNASVHAACTPRGPHCRSGNGRRVGAGAPQVRAKSLSVVRRRGTIYAKADKIGISLSPEVYFGPRPRPASSSAPAPHWQCAAGRRRADLLTTNLRRLAELSYECTSPVVMKDSSQGPSSLLPVRSSASPSAWRRSAPSSASRWSSLRAT